MTQTRWMEILVGLFVMLGVAAVFVLTMRSSNLATTEAGKQGYNVTARFQNIGSLKQGSAVTMAGVRIGRVIQISVDRDYYEAMVQMKINSLYDYIPEDSDARILTSGLLGEQYIGITAGASDDYLEDGDRIKLTQSAIVLEDLIGKFLTSFTENQTGGSGQTQSNTDSGDGAGSNNPFAPALPEDSNNGTAAGSSNP